MSTLSKTHLLLACGILAMLVCYHCFAQNHTDAKKPPLNISMTLALSIDDAEPTVICKLKNLDDHSVEIAPFDVARNELFLIMPDNSRRSFFIQAGSLTPLAPGEERTWKRPIVKYIKSLAQEPGKLDDKQPLKPGLYKVVWVCETQKSYNESNELLFYKEEVVAQPGAGANTPAKP